MDEERYITDDLSDIETTELLKSLPNYFESSGDILRSAFLNWRFDSFRDNEDKFFELGKAYLITAIVMIDICLDENRDNKADTWIFPILFHIVHGIEVYLKGFNSQYKIFSKLQDEEFTESKIEGQHDIRQLCDISISLLEKNKDKELLAEYKFVKKFIDILYSNTSDMAFARYPIKNDKKTKQFYVDQSKNITIDLDVLKQWTNRIYMILDNTTSYISNQIDQTKEWLYEMQCQYGDNTW